MSAGTASARRPCTRTNSQQGGALRPGKRADYVLRFQPDMPIAVVEAKPEYRTPGEGLQQAKAYAKILGLSFAFATNGSGILAFDYTAGVEREISEFPTPDEALRGPESG